LTIGKTMVMGRKNFESILKRLGKPLPQRKNVVITRQKDYKAPEGVLVYNDFNTAIKDLSAEDIYIIGGADIYRLALPLAEIMYMTHVEGNFDGDVFFPEVDWNQWEKVEEEKHEGFTFAKYKRKV
jgi:dihydrofolate reductase